MKISIAQRTQKQIMADDGFTLIELMIALAIASILVAVLGTVFRNQQRTGVTQSLVAEVQQNIRAAIYVMGKEIRMVGYDPRKTTNTGITAATSNTLTFTLVADTDDTDNDGDGTEDEVDELQTIVYYLYDSQGDGGTDMCRKDGPNRCRGNCREY